MFLLGQSHSPKSFDREWIAISGRSLCNFSHNVHEPLKHNAINMSDKILYRSLFQVVPGGDAVQVTPNPYQGNFSYMCLADVPTSAPNGKRIVIQFRHQERDLWSTTEAHKLHGVIVPLVSFQETYSDFFVYTSSAVSAGPWNTIYWSPYG